MGMFRNRGSGRKAKDRRQAPRDTRSGRVGFFDLADLATYRRAQNEAVIRGLCRTAYLGEGAALCRVLGRYKMFVDTRDVGLAPHLMLDGYWEMWHTEALVANTRAGMKVVDVGANLGYFTVLLADLVGPAGTVHAFEPNPLLARKLSDSLEVNGFAARSTVHPVALSDMAGAAGLAASDDQPKNATLVPADAPNARFPIEMRRMDADPDLLDADLIKIDVEGAEQAVWAGMEGVLAQGRSMTIVVEFAACRYPDPGGFLDELTAQGFGLNLITFEEGVVPMTREALLNQPAFEDQLILLRR